MITNCLRNVINYSLTFGLQERVPKRIQLTFVFNGFDIDKIGGRISLIILRVPEREGQGETEEVNHSRLVNGSLISKTFTYEACLRWSRDE